jgi:hypothetical protein
MVQALLSLPVYETNERVSAPFWACAGTLATMAVTESSAKLNKRDFMAIPCKLNSRNTRDSCITAQKAKEVPAVN